jgi:hypothetical protein
MHRKLYRPDEVEKRLLEDLVRRGGEAHRTHDLDSSGRSIAESVADRLNIPRTEVNQMVRRSDGRPGSGWQNNLDWAAKRLRNRGYLQPPDPAQKGVWKVTPQLLPTLLKLASENGFFEKSMDDVDNVLWDLRFRATGDSLEGIAQFVRNQYRDGKTLPFEIGRL